MPCPCSPRFLVRLYALSVSLKGTLSVGLTGSDTTIGEVGQQIITDLSEIDSPGGHDRQQLLRPWCHHQPLMILFCVILMAYAVIKVFFANLKRGGILLIQIAVGKSLYVSLFREDTSTASSSG